jgi:XTP/dITP diphosphohydrolase
LNRAALFHATIVFVEHAMDPDPVIAQGRWHGEILKSPRGDGGFGYDPLFYIADVQLSAAELSTQEKNHRSHRGQALRALTHQLNIRFQQ